MTASPPRPPNRRPLKDMRGPVEWLLGPSLIGKLRKIVLSQLFNKDLDLRDWMHATTRSRYAADGTRTEVPIDEPPVASAAPPDLDSNGIWFDFIADTGDSQLAMYSLACLLFQDLHVDPATTPSVERPPQVLTEASPDAAPATWKKLERSRFLIMGGDTCYHVADTPTLTERVVEPFRWALEDVPNGKDGTRREVFAIPGNHDYFDQLVGFNRMFRVLVDKHQAIKRTPLEIPGFVRAQEASYFRIELPYG